MLTGQLLNRNEIDEVKWNLFVDNSPQHSIYCKSWYLDSICQQWKGIVISSNNLWLSIIPLNINSKLSIKYSIQPIFAQYLGILFAPFNLSIHKELGLKKDIINIILNLLPANLKIINYNFNPTFKYFLPFYWKEFDISPRLSYQLTLNKKINEIALDYSSRIKDDIKKSKKNKLICIENKCIEELIGICKTNKILNNGNCSMFQNLWKQVTLRDIGFCVYIKDSNGNIHCGGAFIKDQEKIIFILLSTKPEYKNQGSTSLLINESIRIATEDSNIKYFDFEGSMIEPIENYFRGFNPSPITYYNVKKNKISGLSNLYQRMKVFF